MFDRIAQFAVGGGELLQAEGRLFIHRLTQLWVHAGLLLLAAIILMLGALALAVALGMLLAQWVGVIGSIALLAVGFIVAGLVLLIVARRAARRALQRDEVPPAIRRRIRASKDVILNQRSAPDVPHDAHAQPSLKHKALAFVGEHPGVTAGAALTAVGLLGPVRAFRFVGRAVMAAGIVSGVTDQLFADHARSDQPHESAPKRLSAEGHTTPRDADTARQGDPRQRFSEGPESAA